MALARHFVVISIMLASAGALSAQTSETGLEGLLILNRSLVLEGTEYRYQVYLPPAYRSSEAWPVILALHGGGSRGSDGVRQTGAGMGRAIRGDMGRFPAITVFPQAPHGPGFQGLAGRIAMAALDRTLQEFSTDSTRVYLMGQSMGGNGSWYLAYHHPARFAAAVIVCGYVEEFTFSATVPQIAPASAPDPFAAVAQRVAGIPIWLFHGADDETVPVLSVDVGQYPLQRAFRKRMDIPRVWSPLNNAR
jgi:predicted peptidase